jgi:hypothetical protein
MIDASGFEFWWRTVNLIGIAWLLGWGFALLKFPERSYRILNRGKSPTPTQLKTIRAVAYLGLGCGALWLTGFVVGLVRSR